MNSEELKAEIVKVEQEIKKLVEEASTKFNILSGMKNAYNNVLASIENKAKAEELNVKSDIAKDLTSVANKIDPPASGQ